VDVLAGAIFQLGPEGIRKHTETLKMIKEGRYRDAAAEIMYRSIWGTQTAGRVRRFNKLLIGLE
jgi:GH24 family phage-related lysozyme (muramidase)